jgi:hypothetical protein
VDGPFLDRSPRHLGGLPHQSGLAAIRPAARKPAILANAMSLAPTATILAMKLRHG